MYRIKLLKMIDGLVGRGASFCLPSPTPQGVGDCASILIIRPGGIGDAVLLAPTVKALQELFPGVVLDVLAERRNSGAFLLMEGIRRIFRYDSPGDMFSLLPKRYDAIIDTEQWHRLSAVVARLIRSRVKIGFATNERRRLFTHPVVYSPTKYEAEGFLSLLEPFKGPHNPVRFGGCLSVPRAAQDKASLMLGDLSGKPILALFPSASIPQKRWASGNFREVIKWCGNHDLAVVMLGGEGDRMLGEDIACGQNVLNLIGQTTLPEAAAILQKAAVVVSGDSGLLHLACCLETPTISIFGPSNSDKWAPRGPGHFLVSQMLSCAPCSQFGFTPNCSIGVECLREIPVSRVTEAIQTLLHEMEH